jgi:hypothetical protein
MPISRLEHALEIAHASRARLLDALASGGVELPEILSVNAAVLGAERALAAAKGEQHAVPIDFPAEWDIGAPLPHLLQNDYRAFLVFHLREVAPPWLGTKIRYSSAIEAERIAVVEFGRCISTKMGMPRTLWRAIRCRAKGLPGTRH